MSDTEREDTRAIRLFVSSTFQDMSPERDELVKRVFPVVRGWCAERGASFCEVDLRWGITDEQAAEGRVLSICLEEVDASRPYFLGILGDRYGYVPEAIPAEVLDRHSWVRGLQGRSVTELEIRYGALANPARDGAVRFYFRAEGTAAGGARCGEPDEACERLTRLKQEISASGLPLRDGYRDATQLGEWVLEDLRQILDDRLPPAPPASPEALEDDAQRLRVASLAGRHVGREPELTRLTNFAASGGPPLAVIGAAASGKSSLLACWCMQLEQGGAPGDALVIYHFATASPAAADPNRMIQTILRRLRQELGIVEHIPEEPARLRAALGNWLHMAASRRRVIIVVDGADFLEDRDGARDLLWLPRDVPPAVRLVVSTRDGRTANAARERGCEELHLTPITLSDRRVLIERFLSRYSKALSEQRVARIADAPVAGFPAFIIGLLEEIRVFGAHERLDTEIDRYLSVGDLERLYVRILERYVRDYEADRPGLVGTLFGLLLTGRRGLREAELLECLGDDAGPLPAARWAPIHQSAGAFIEEHSDTLLLSNEVLRQAVRRCFGLDEQALHRRLADYFASRPLDSRKVEELAFHLRECGDYQRLADALADLALTAAMSTAGAGKEVVDCWRLVEQETGRRAIAVHAQLIEAPWTAPEHAVHLADVLLALGYTADAEELLRWLARAARFALRDHRREANSQIRLIMAKVAAGYALEACTFNYADAIAAARQAPDDEVEARCMAEWASMLQQRGLDEEAESTLRGAAEIFARLGSTYEQGSCWNNLGILEEKRGHFAAAIESYESAQRIFERAGAIAGVAWSLDHLALARWKSGETRPAVDLWGRAQRLFRDTNDLQGLAISLSNVGALISLGERPELAQAPLQEAKRLVRSLDQPRLLARVLCSEVMVEGRLGTLEGASLQEAIDLCRRTAQLPLMGQIMQLLLGFLRSREPPPHELTKPVAAALDRVQAEIADGPRPVPVLRGERVDERLWPTPNYIDARGRSEEVWRRQLEHARRHAPAVLAHECWMYGLALRARGCFADSIAIFDEMIEAARRGGDHRKALDAYSQKSLSARLSGDATGALRHLLDQEAYAREIDDLEQALRSIETQQERLAELGAATSSIDADVQARVASGAERIIAAARARANPRRRAEALLAIVNTGTVSGTTARRLRAEASRLRRRRGRGGGPAPS